MKLTSKALEAINNRAVKFDLCLALGFTEVWVNKLVEQNKDNGPLTTAKGLEVIREATGLSDSEILEETESAKVAS